MSLYIAYIAFICTPHFADGDLAHIRRKLAPLRSNLNFRALVRTTAAWPQDVARAWAPVTRHVLLSESAVARCERPLQLK